MAGAPKRNGNAVGLGLYASDPPREIKVVAEAEPALLAGYGRGMAESAMWIAEELTGVIDGLSGKGFNLASKAIGLYAAVAQELFQVAAELEGAAGIKPAPLGNLSEAGYERLMDEQARALELILNQCMTAARRLRMGEEIRAAAAEAEKAEDGKKILDQIPGLLVRAEGELEPHPALAYLAAHMRSAKRILRDMAANRAWKERGQQKETDLGERLMEVISNGAK